MFSIKNLANNNEKVKRKMIFVYERVFNMCKKEIIYKDKIGYKSFLFIPPSKISGEPDYEISDCLRYIIDKLRKGGFTVFYKHPAKILIIWDCYEKYNKLIDNTRFLYNEDKKTEKFYNEFTQGTITDAQNITKKFTAPKKPLIEDIKLPKLKYCGN